MRKTYLGDGLYAEDEGYRVRLYASNGITTTDEVWLDSDMLHRLNVFMQREDRQ